MAITEGQQPEPGSTTDAQSTNTVVEIDADFKVDGSATEQEVVIVTGMSGAGRSTVANALEDLGWFVVDNLPPQMLRPLVELAAKAGSSAPRIVAVVDIRGRNFFSEFQAILQALRVGVKVRVVFLDATDQTLIRRFESVRRPHPLQGDGTLLQGISSERLRLAEIRGASDIVIDSSDLNVHQLAKRTNELFADRERLGVHVTLQSFGFKYGVPSDVDFVIDARFLPNPYWVHELRDLNGEDSLVSEYVLSREGAQEFLDGYLVALKPVFEGYERENKRNVTLALGCTGGKHRSVALALELAARLELMLGVEVNIRHRDLGRE